ncbi:MAG: 2-C-methyl-D-erythritol 2,4-cyclodiphosphate synthase [Phascolarctobacterium sp.]|nr:2-C-methyl-D-erythritol 2,4-cyclodiphosphate synthase [Candidatus Phascolarctobacterium caballi]
MFRVGTGYDVHRLVSGKKLVLCGVHIEHILGLDGHSDADVAVHALMDALLGALALGDIGHLFPDTDQHFAGADSLQLLKKVIQIIREKGWHVSNIDITIIAQKPKIAPYIMQMRENLAQILEIIRDCVSVKATTTEGLGFTGREEGIAAQAVVLLAKNKK